VHIAGVHLYCPKTRTFNVPFVQQTLQDQAAVLINLGVWEEGLLVAPGNPKGISSVKDLAHPDVKVINREPGAGSRDLLEQALVEADLSLQDVMGNMMGNKHPEGSMAGQRLAYSHEAVAQAVLAGDADVGVSAASVASMFRLDFIPLRKSHYDLVTLKSYLEEAPVQQLLGTLGHRRVISQLEILGGYDTQLTGEVVATVKPETR
jgi:molybdate-binding protein